MGDEGDNTRDEVQADPTVVFISGFEEATVDDLTAQFKDLNVSPVKVDLVGRQASSALLKFESDAEASAALQSLTGKYTVVRLDRGPTRSRRRGRRPDSEPSEPAPPNFVFVGNLPSGTKVADLTEYFASRGTVKSSKVIGSWGIVQFETEDEAKAVVGATGHVMDGQELKVETLRNAPRKRTKKPRAPAGDKPARAEKSDKAAREPAPRRPVINFTASNHAKFYDLKKVFSDYGPVHSFEFRKGDTIGSGTVVYETEDAAVSAMEGADGTNFEGATLDLTRVNTAGRRKPRRRTSRKTKAPKETDERAPKEANESAPKETKERQDRPPRNRNRRRGPPRSRANNDGGAPQEQRQRAPREPRETKEPREPREPRQRRERVKKTPVVREVADEQCHLFLGNLAYSVKSEDLQTLLGSKGIKVVEAVVAQGRNDRSRGFGSVEVVNRAEAEKAIAELNGIDFEGRPLIVRKDQFVKSA